MPAIDPVRSVAAASGAVPVVTAKPRKGSRKAVQPHRGVLVLDSFATGAMVGWVLPGPSMQLALAKQVGDRPAKRVTELAAPFLFVASAVSAVVVGAACGLARLVRGG